MTVKAIFSELGFTETLCAGVYFQWMDSTTTQVQSDIDRVVHFRLIWYLLTTFRRRHIYFLKSDFKFFDDACRHPADAYNARRYADRPICQCIINLHWADG